MTPRVEGALLQLRQKNLLPTLNYQLCDGGRMICFTYGPSYIDLEVPETGPCTVGYIDHEMSALRNMEYDDVADALTFIFGLLNV